MARYLQVILLCAWACCCKAQQQQAAIAFYNVENLFDTLNDPATDDDAFTPAGKYKYTDSIYRKKLHNTSYVLGQLAVQSNRPALIGLAEIENDVVLQDLVKEEALKPYGYKYVWHNSADPRGIDVALLYQPKQFRLLGSKAIPVLLQVSRATEHTRDILLVSGLLGSDSVHILVNHWPSRREGKGTTADKRGQAAAIARSIVDSLYARNPKNHIIVMGDLNDDPGDESVARILGARDTETTLLCNPWLAIHKTGAGSLAYQKKWNLFDQVIISRSLVSPHRGWRFSKAEIFNKDFLVTRSGKQQGYPYRSWLGYFWMNGYSDHFPVVLYLVK